MAGMGNGERDNAVGGRDRFDPWAGIGRRPPFFRTVKGEQAKSQREARAIRRINEYSPFGTVEEKPASVLFEADSLVGGARGSVYGPPAKDFGKVTGMALALWGRGPETPAEHALYMVLVKLARLEASPGHRDSIVDACGYLQTYEQITRES